MLRSIFGFDWKKSQPHLLLLSKFIHASDPNFFQGFWENVLNESPLQAIKRFQKDGFITVADLENTIAAKYTLADLKSLLKQYKLPVSGRKEDLIKRLISADSDGMKKITSNVTVFQLTQVGKELAEEYITNEQEKRNQVETQVQDLLRARKFKEASIAVAIYESEQVFPRGINMDWGNHNPDGDVEIISAIFEDKPKILSRLQDEKSDILREGAAIMHLWGKNTARQWLPKDFETGLMFDVDTAARMFLFHASYKVTLNRYQKSEVVKSVRIHSAGDACEECSKFADKEYNLYQVPELPHSNCAHKKGCRCVLLPIVLLE